MPNRIGGQLLVMQGVVAPQLLAVKLVAAVHRFGKREFILPNPTGPRLGFEIGDSICRNRRRIDEHDGTAVRFP